MSSMTIDRIRIETQEEADAVPHGSVVVGGVVSPYDRPIPGKDVLTHIAIPAADAIEARRVLLAEAWALTETWPMSESDAKLSADLTGIADLILPPVLANAAKQQATPDTVMVELPRDVVERVAQDDGAALVGPQIAAACRAALDAEGGQG